MNSRSILSSGMPVRVLRTAVFGAFTALAMISLQTTGAKADTFDWSLSGSYTYSLIWNGTTEQYSYIPAPNSGDTVTGSGTLSANPDLAVWSVTAMSGTINVGTSPTTTYTVSGPTGIPTGGVSYKGSDEFISVPAGNFNNSPYQVDPSGLAFTVNGSNQAFDIYYWYGAGADGLSCGGPEGIITGGGPNALCMVGPGTLGVSAAYDPLIELTSFTVTPVSATPLPAALPLFATGLGALGLLGWRRKRKAQLTA
jgi:hypothetical protein